MSIAGSAIKFYILVSPNNAVNIRSHVDHDILDCTEQNEPLQPYRSFQPEKIEGGDKDWNVLAVCSIVKSINFAKSAGCEGR
jgi:hypothetical protein